VNYAQPGLRGYCLVFFHVAMSTGFVYMVGYDLERLVTRLRLGPRLR
jgi:hypothetical protein